MAAILVAGMFAFMPVEKASTVHTTITGQMTITGNRSRSKGGVWFRTKHSSRNSSAKAKSDPAGDQEQRSRISLQGSRLPCIFFKHRYW
ncbi:MAG: hypothetical protein QXU32_13155 [Nitrososphaerales archaeon]